MSVVFVSKVNKVAAQGVVLPCEGGSSGLGGPQIPDLNSDGCVDEADVSMMLSCWGYTISTAPRSCLAQAIVLSAGSTVAMTQSNHSQEILGVQTIASEVHIKTLDTTRQIRDFIFSFLASTTGLSSLLWVFIRGGLFV